MNEQARALLRHRTLVALSEPGVPLIAKLPAGAVCPFVIWRPRRSWL